MKLSIEEQVEYVERHGERAFARALRYMKDHREEIIAAMADGIRAGAGAGEHGDRNWRASHAELEREKLEECRDLCNYVAMQMRQGWPK